MQHWEAREGWITGFLGKLTKARNWVWFFLGQAPASLSLGPCDLGSLSPSTCREKVHNLAAPSKSEFWRQEKLVWNIMCPWAWLFVSRTLFLSVSWFMWFQVQHTPLDFPFQGHTHTESLGDHSASAPWGYSGEDWDLEKAGFFWHSISEQNPVPWLERGIHRF